MMDLTDAALRERLDRVIDACNDKHGTGDYDNYQICDRCILAFGADLRDVARAEQREDDMIAVCNRCAGDPRGPGQHEIENCAAAAIRAQGTT